YDSNGNLISIADPLSNSTTLQYDAKSNLTALTDPKGNVLLKVAYNADGTVASYVERGETWTVAYDPANKKTTETDSSFNVWTHYYNQFGSIIKTVDPLSNFDSRVYDSNLNPVQYTDKNGHTTITAFDALGNPLSIQDSLNNKITLTYDPVF